MLGGTLPRADSDGYLCTVRVSTVDHPWLADHALAGTVLLPGTAFVDLAVRAGSEAGCGKLDELTLHAPLLLPVDGAAQLQLVVDEPDATGRRPVAVYSRRDSGAWTRHAAGTVAPQGIEPPTEVAGPPDRTGVWPPADAGPVDLTGFYDELFARGYDYGPAFRLLRAAWRRGEEVFAEVALPDELAGRTDRFGVHPALLDAALHVVSVGGLVPDVPAGQTVLPFTVSGVEVYATGAVTLRVALSRSPEGVRVRLAHGAGKPGAAIDSLGLRPGSAP